MPGALQLAGRELLEIEPERDVPPASRRSAQSSHHDQVAQLDGRPFPPGRYPLVVVRSGPGGMQLAYSLSRPGVGHAALSADDAPGGMVRKWPLVRGMLSWTKPCAGFQAGWRGCGRQRWA